MSASLKAAMPVFSYAQAAKGAKTSAPIKPNEFSSKDEPQEQSAKSSQKSEPDSNTPRASRSRPRTEEKESQPVTQEQGADATVPEETLDKENLPPSWRSRQRSDTSQASVSAAMSPQPSQAIGSPKAKEALDNMDPTDSWEKASQASHSLEKSTAADKDKTKDSEDDWEKVSVPSVTAEKELKAAPPPAVNVWAARLEAQAAKRKEIPAPSQTVSNPSTPSTRPKSHGDESKRKVASRDTSEKEVTAFRKSDPSGKPAEPSSVQASRPSSQHGEKATAAVPPPVDKMFWPTPDNVTVDDRRKSSGQDKIDKPEAKTNGSKSHGNKWITVPFVPTAKFETPLPAMAAKRGGRGGRGRDGQPRGAHSGTGGDRQEPGSMGPPPLPNKTNDQDRGRKSEGQRDSRASSLPANNRRPTSRESTLASLRKPATPLKEGIPSASPLPSNDPGSELVNGAPTSSAKEQSRSSSRPEAADAGDYSNGDVFVSETPQQNGVEPDSSSVAEVAGHPAHGQDSVKPSQSGYRPSGDPSRERGIPHNRDYSREKSDAAREKVESWRDRDLSGESNSRRERSDRGRGGYRGRGNHSYSSNQAHPYTAPLPQNGFEPTKVNSNGEPRSRQSSQPFTMANASNGSRSNPRSHSIPVGMMYQNFYGTAGMPQGMSPLQTDMSGYPYPNQLQMEQGVMSAMPYSNSLNSYAVMSMVVGQIEYYFSIDNLCKDMFLRKNMDSQGWVPLRVVANFKRIKALTEENFPWETMRYVCSQVRNVEHLLQADGEDKIRSRENWRDFVLPVNERFPAAQNDGPHLPPMPPQQIPYTSHARPEAGPVASPSIRSPSSATANPNEMYETASPQTFAPIPPLDGSVAERNFNASLPTPAQDLPRRESAHSPKVQHHKVFRDRPTGQMLSPVANGHRRQPSRNFNEEVLFPDEGIAGIRICVQDASADSHIEDASAVPQISRIVSNESRGSLSEMAPFGITRRVSGLRGGAGAQEQSVSNLQGMVFGSAGDQTTGPEEVTLFVNKDGRQSQIPAAKPGQFFMTYSECHAESFKNHAIGVPDAMKTLYNFWSTFLVDKFNLGMYQDFKTVALQDLSQGDESGVTYLMQYYQAVLKNKPPVSEAVASDLVFCLRDEADGNARVYKMMRLAWRNGALNLKTRKRIGDLLLDEEKASFDKGG